MKKKRKQLTTIQIMVPGFAVLILLGGILLSMPFCNRSGEWLSFVDALFTACTCICVTGLVTIVPAWQFTAAGQAIMLILIQIGGLGIIVLVLYALVTFRRRISLNSKVLLQNHFGLSNLNGLVPLLIFVVKGTVIVEGLGALGFMVRFIPTYGIGKGIWFSVFHAVSAFCNAGVDLIGDNSLMNYQTDLWMNIVAHFLIIMGGLGFLVWRELGIMIKRIISSGFRVKRAVNRLALHAKITLVMTIGLLFAGTLLFAALEWNNPETLGGMSVWNKWLLAYFQSVTTRTAGFYTMPQASMTDTSKFISCIFMLIGGSPAGTAGGVKTVTVAVLAMTCWSIMKGSIDTECYRRKIVAETVRMAMIVFFMGFLMVLIGTTVLSIFEPEYPLIDLLFETTSSVATVGLTADITPNLNLYGKCTVMGLMFIGRIGPVTIPLVIASKLGRKKHRSLPEEHIIVG